MRYHFPMECSLCQSPLIDDAAFCPQCGTRQPDVPECDTYDYAAFVSYRHRQPDADVAALVHESIERYRLPKTVAAQYGAPKLGRAFRDQEELPATDSLPVAIRNALRHSRTLVVVCSSATPESRWIAQEIEQFASFHGRDRIFAVLAEGASAKSMPPSLRHKLAIDAQGGIARIATEPLAADMRASAKNRLDDEKLRIIAAIAGCSYDDLRRREATRKRKRMMAIAAAAVALTTAIGGLAFAAFQQHDAALVQESQRLAAESQQLLAQGDRYGAIETALEALPSSSSDTSRPLVPEAQEALEAALQIHPSNASPWQSSYTVMAAHGLGYFDGISMTGQVDAGAEDVGNSSIALSDEGGYFAVSDSAGGIGLYDLATGKHRADCIMPAGADESGTHLHVLAALEDRLLVSDPPSGTFACFDAQSGEALWSGDGIGIATMAPLADGTTVLGAQFAQDGGFSAEATDAGTGSTSQFAAAIDAGALPLEGGVRSAASSDGTRLLVATGGKLACAQRETGGITEVPLAYPNASALACYGDVSLVGTVESYDGEETACRYAIEAFDADLHKLWETKGTVAPELLAGAGAGSIVLGWPAFHGTTLSESAAVASIGRQVFAFDLNTGKAAYECGFASTVLAVRPWATPDDGSDRLFIACADGSIVAENPADPNHNYDGGQFRMQLGEPICWSAIGYHDGLFTWLSASAEADSRLIAYRTDLTNGMGAEREYTLDELLELARITLEQGR